MLIISESSKLNLDEVENPLSISRFVFCRAYQAYAGNEEQKAENAIDDKRFDIPCVA